MLTVLDDTRVALSFHISRVFRDVKVFRKLREADGERLKTKGFLETDAEVVPGPDKRSTTSPGICSVLDEWNTPATPLAIE